MHRGIIRDALLARHEQEPYPYQVLPSPDPDSKQDGVVLFKDDDKKRTTTKNCWFCDRPCKPRRCKRCKNVFYCSKTCRLRDWESNHQGVCQYWKPFPPETKTQLVQMDSEMKSEDERLCVISTIFYLILHKRFRPRQFVDKDGQPVFDLGRWYHHQDRSILDRVLLLFVELDALSFVRPRLTGRHSIHVMALAKLLRSKIKMPMKLPPLSDQEKPDPLCLAMAPLRDLLSQPELLQWRLVCRRFYYGMEHLQHKYTKNAKVHLCTKDQAMAACQGLGRFRSVTLEGDAVLGLERPIQTDELYLQMNSESKLIWDWRSLIGSQVDSLVPRGCVSGTMDLSGLDVVSLDMTSTFNMAQDTKWLLPAELQELRLAADDLPNDSMVMDLKPILAQVPRLRRLYISMQEYESELLRLLMQIGTLPPELQSLELDIPESYPLEELHLPDSVACLTIPAALLSCIHCKHRLHKLCLFGKSLEPKHDVQADVLDLSFIKGTNFFYELVNEIKPQKIICPTIEWMAERELSDFVFNASCVVAFNCVLSGSRIGGRVNDDELGMILDDRVLRARFASVDHLCLKTAADTRRLRDKVRADLQIRILEVDHKLFAEVQNDLRRLTNVQEIRVSLPGSETPLCIKGRLPPKALVSISLPTDKKENKGCSVLDWHDLSHYNIRRSVSFCEFSHDCLKEKEHKWKEITDGMAAFTICRWIDSGTQDKLELDKWDYFHLSDGTFVQKNREFGTRRRLSFFKANDLCIDQDFVKELWHWAESVHGIQALDLEEYCRKSLDEDGLTLTGLELLPSDSWHVQSFRLFVQTIADKKSEPLMLVPAWHGYSRASIDSLCKHGPAPSGEGLHGPGFYASLSPGVAARFYSERDLKREGKMLLCLAALGPMPVFEENFETKDKRQPLTAFGELIPVSAKHNKQTLNLCFTQTSRIAFAALVSFRDKK